MPLTKNERKFNALVRAEVARQLDLKKTQAAVGVAVRDELRGYNTRITIKKQVQSIVEEYLKVNKDTIRKSVSTFLKKELPARMKKLEVELYF